jgi:hypothetical protein
VSDGGCFIGGSMSISSGVISASFVAIIFAPLNVVKKYQN